MNISKIFIDTMATMKPVLLKIFPKEVLQKAKKKWLYKNIKQLAEVDVAPYSREMFPEGINLIGNIKGSSGLGQSARLLALELESTKYPVDIVQHSISDKLNISVEKIAARVHQLKETNPMLGHRGCRLAVTYPEILEMQVRAIITAACECSKNGIEVHPEIMIPLIIDIKEFHLLESKVRAVAEQILKENNVSISYKVGTMIEIPRAALLADEIAEYAEFFSFGTNDLTQMTLGMSRDDSGKFLPEYIDEKKAAIFHDDPFQSIDQ